MCIAAGEPKKKCPNPESFIFYVKAKIWFEKEIKNAYRVKHRGRGVEGGSVRLEEKKGGEENRGKEYNTLGRKEVSTFKFQKKTIHYTKGVWWGCVCCEGVCIVGWRYDVSSSVYYR